MKYFHGSSKIRQYFEGWYFKQQDENITISFIPGIQYNQDCCASAFIQVITEHKVHYITFPISKFYADKNLLFIKIGKNLFTEQGIAIDIDEKDIAGNHVKIKGNFYYKRFMPLPYSIMGPLKICHLPCNHEVISMRHEVSGEIMIGERPIKMKHGIGYIETDFGSSFPNDYFWTQYNSKGKFEPQIFASIATIPFGCREWIGSIAVINYDHRQYRFATYLGARVLVIRESLAIIQQRNLILVIHVEANRPQKLKAPVSGKMSRIIHEDIECIIRYELYDGKQQIFDITTNRGSAEYQVRKK